MPYDDVTHVSQPVVSTRQLAVDPDDVLGALAARRDLGPGSDAAVVAAFLDHAGQAIDARVDQRVAEHMAASGRPGNTRTEADRWRSSALKLALGSIALAFPTTGVVMTQDRGSGVILVVLIWAAITAINLSFHRSGRR